MTFQPPTVGHTHGYTDTPAGSALAALREAHMDSYSDSSDLTQVPGFRLGDLRIDPATLEVTPALGRRELGRSLAYLE